MGVVTKHLSDLLAKQVDDYKLVVWYDPECAYADVAANIDLPNTAIARYDGSFLQLRSEISDLLNGEEHWAIACGIDVDAKSTWYEFHSLRPLRGRHSPQELTLRSTGEKIAEGFIRPYAICKTPKFLKG